MAANKKGYTQDNVDSFVEKMLLAEAIPKDKQELTRNEALNLMAKGFTDLFRKGYSIKNIADYIKNNDCPVKGIKQSEIEERIESYTSKKKRKSSASKVAVNSEQKKHKGYNNEDQTQGGAGIKEILEAPNEIIEASIDNSTFDIEEDCSSDEL